jgi:predicted nucleic acid-binding protein
MVYLDTNVLIYASVTQDPAKKERSIELLDTLIAQDKLVLSTLTLQEFAFTMAKLGIDDAIIHQDSMFYMNYVTVEHDFALMNEAIELCCEHHACKHINDILHLLLAHRARSTRFVTYDKGFKKLRMLSEIEIEVLT